jgi:hypothetical protein
MLVWILKLLFVIAQGGDGVIPTPPDIPIQPLKVRVIFVMDELSPPTMNSNVPKSVGAVHVPGLGGVTGIEVVVDVDVDVDVDVEVEVVDVVELDDVVDVVSVVGDLHDEKSKQRKREKTAIVLVKD